MIFIDTHVAVFLAGRELGRLSRIAKNLLEQENVVMSPICVLELHFLYKIGRLKQNSDSIFSFLKNTLNINLSTTSYENIIKGALNLDWTRDIFDRLIVGECIANGAKLITKDTHILENYSGAIWN